MRYEQTMKRSNVNDAEVLSLAVPHQHGLLLSHPHWQTHPEDYLWEAASQRTTGANTSLYLCGNLYSAVCN